MLIYNDLDDKFISVIQRASASIKNEKGRTEERTAKRKKEEAI